VGGRFVRDSYFLVSTSASLFYGRLLHLLRRLYEGRLGVTARKMSAQFSSYDWRDGKLREWLLLLLRYSVTRESRDRAAALAMADELDSLGCRWRPSSPSFFEKTSNEVCEAIRAPNEGESIVRLHKHIARIDDPRLRQAFRAAVGLEQTSNRQSIVDGRPNRQACSVPDRLSRQERFCLPMNRRHAGSLRKSTGPGKPPAQ
jgi:hypothetical protein